LELENSGVNTREVACSRRLVFLRLESKRVNVNTSSRDISVVLIRLDEVEVRTKTLLEAIVSVKLKLGTDDRVATSVERGETSVVGTTARTRIGSKVGRSIVCRECTRTKLGREVDTGVEESFDFTSSAINVTVMKVGSNVREGTSHVSSFNIGMKNLLTRRNTVSPFGPKTINIVVISIVSPLVDVRSNNSIALDDPYEFLDRVVEIEFNLNVSVYSRFISGELELFNEIFVRTLGESATFIGIKVNVINE